MESPATLSKPILEWLSSVESARPSCGTKRKRRGSPQDQPRDHPRLPSPTVSSRTPGLPSLSAASTSSTLSLMSLRQFPSTPPLKKRPRHDGHADLDADADADATPRPPLAVPTPLRSLSDAASSIASSESSSSAVSRRSSPLKQLRAMELYDDGFTHRKFADSPGRLPATLVVLMRKLRRIGRGVGVIPPSVKPDVEASLYVDDISDDAFCSEPGHEPAQRALPWRTAVLVMQRANECEVLGEEEAAWNAEVHHNLLRWTFRPEAQRQLVDFRMCTSATISTHYRPRNAPHKLVDFCICINPSVDSQASPVQARIDELRNRRPGQSINHTDYPPLQERPIAVSVETKKPGGDLTNATLQVGTWHAAQFRSLAALKVLADTLGGLGRGEHGVRPAGDRRGDRDMGDAGEGTSEGTQPGRDKDEDEAEAQNQGEGIPFLPGILIHGHDWSFVASTPAMAARPDDKGQGSRDGHGMEGQKAALYTKIPLGTTETPLGIYSIVAALQCLGAWVEESYWPAFSGGILGLRQPRVGQA